MHICTIIFLPINLLFFSESCKPKDNSTHSLKSKVDIEILGLKMLPEGKKVSISLKAADLAHVPIVTLPPHHGEHAGGRNGTEKECEGQAVLRLWRSCSGIRALRGSHGGNRAKQPSSSSKSHHLVESVNTISSLPYITLTPDRSQMQRRIEHFCSKACACG